MVFLENMNNLTKKLGLLASALLAAGMSPTYSSLEERLAAQEKTVQAEKEPKIVYAQNFKENPNWDTNSPQHFYWVPQENAYFMHLTRTPAGEYERASFQFPNPVKGSFTLSWEVKPTTFEWAGDFHLGLFKDSSMKLGYHLRGGLSNPDTGAGINVDGNTNTKEENVADYNPDMWKLNEWHRAVLSYDHEKGIARYELSRLDEPGKKFSVEFKNKLFFDEGFVRIGATTFGLTPYKGSFAEGYIRNIELKQ
ncbi:MAG: hypothetical protein RL557_1093 [archaeon]|jgi:hypothetical protein